MSVRTLRTMASMKPSAAGVADRASEHRRAAFLHTNPSRDRFPDDVDDAIEAVEDERGRDGGDARQQPEREPALEQAEGVKQHFAGGDDGEARARCAGRAVGLVLEDADAGRPASAGAESGMRSSSELARAGFCHASQAAPASTAAMPPRRDGPGQSNGGREVEEHESIAALATIT